MCDVLFKQKGKGKIAAVSVLKYKDNEYTEEVYTKERACFDVRNAENTNAISNLAKRMVNRIYRLPEDIKEEKIGFKLDKLVICYTFSNSILVEKSKDLRLLKQAVEECAKNIAHVCPTCGRRLVRIPTGNFCTSCGYNERIDN